jgi:Tfp pilus assembly protein PilN
MMTGTTTRTGFTQVNLLPPETQEAHKTRRQTSLVLAAGVAVIAVVALFAFMQGAKVADLEDKVSAQDAKNATLQAQAANLQHFEAMRTSLASQQQLVSSALSGDVSWSNILHQLSSAIPSKMWINSLAGSTTQGQAVEGATASPTTTPTTLNSDIIGSLTFQGQALDTDTLSEWLVRLQRVEGWVNPWLSSAQKTAVGSTTVFSFGSSVDLSSDAISARGGGK